MCRGASATSGWSVRRRRPIFRSAIGRLGADSGPKPLQPSHWQARLPGNRDQPQHLPPRWNAARVSLGSARPRISNTAVGGRTRSARMDDRLPDLGLRGSFGNLFHLAAVDVEFTGYGSLAVSSIVPCSYCLLQRERRRCQGRAPGWHQSWPRCPRRGSTAPAVVRGGQCGWRRVPPWTRPRSGRPP
jgi:hypothetical protein